MIYVEFAAGLLFLGVGAELLVRGSSRLAALMGVSPLVIGLTVVAYGTSAPEIFVSADAALHGDPDIALGNAVGSNILNVLLILGACAAIAPLAVPRQLVRRDTPIMIAVSVLLLALARDGMLRRNEGVLLLLGLLGYGFLTVLASRRGRSSLSAGVAAENSCAAGGFARFAGCAFLAVAGLIMLVAGARWLVEGAVEIAGRLGTSRLVIGLTVVALGTSLPEIATSIAATVRGERDIAVGNVVGSNIFNICGALGVAATLAPSGVRASPGVLGFDLPVMVAVAVACFPIFATGLVIRRWEGFLLLGYYVAYTVFLVMKVHGHGFLPQFGDAMRLFILPVTAMVLLILLTRAIRRGDLRQ